MIDEIKNALSNIKRQKPLILCLTNFVTMEFVANSLLALGAAPIVSTCEDEVEELIKISSAVYINIGTLNSDFIELIKKAARLAVKYEKPVVLDPVGAGATELRTEIGRLMLSFSGITRGNASEIIALKSSIQTTYGVEATNTTCDAKEIAKFLALNSKKNTKKAIMVSGPVDFITDGNQSCEVPFGSSIMQLVTGMGCSVTAVIAAFNAVLKDSFEVSKIAAHYFALCGQIASKNHKSPGTFKTAFLDQLHLPNLKIMKEIYDQRG